jgi:hypothetical protein
LITQDLEEAAANLSSSYPDEERLHPNKYAALALLARVYLYRGMWDKAEAAANQVIVSGLYTPLPALSEVFLKNNTEAIWQLQPINSQYQDTYEGSVFIPAYPGANPQYYLTDHILEAFEQNDQRKTDWINSTVFQNHTYYYPYKYKIGYQATDQPEYYTVLRAAETYLIRAEARAQQNNIAGATEDLSVVRERAGLNPITLPGKEQMLDAISHERQVEFFAEWGHRWFDLIRTGKADAVLAGVKSNWSSTAKLLPVPQSNINFNNQLTQNPGY